MAIINILHTYEPSPILMTLGPITIYWYGLFYTISIFLGYWLVSSTLKRILATHYPLPTTHSAALRLTARLPEFTFALVVVGLIGARLYHVLNEWLYYWEHPLQIFAIWNGGLAIHGALIAGLIYLWLFVHYGLRITDWESKNSQFAIRNKSNIIKFLFLADLLSPAILLGQAIGRWGNYFNQELFGYPTTLPWGIPISPANRPPEFEQFTYFHPTFLYESLWDFVGAIILIIWLSRWRHYKLQATSYKPGLIFPIYLIWMSFGRISIEFFRINTSPLVFGWKLSVLMSMIFVLIGIKIGFLHKSSHGVL